MINHASSYPDTDRGISANPDKIGKGDIDDQHFQIHHWWDTEKVLVSNEDDNGHWIRQVVRTKRSMATGRYVHLAMGVEYNLHSHSRRN